MNDNSNSHLESAVAANNGSCSLLMRRPGRPISSHPRLCQRPSRQPSRCPSAHPVRPWVQTPPCPRMPARARLRSCAAPSRVRSGPRRRHPLRRGGGSPLPPPPLPTVWPSPELRLRSAASSPVPRRRRRCCRLLRPLSSVVWHVSVKVPSRTRRKGSKADVLGLCLDARDSERALLLLDLIAVLPVDVLRLCVSTQRSRSMHRPRGSNDVPQPRPEPAAHGWSTCPLSARYHP